MKLAPAAQPLGDVFVNCPARSHRNDSDGPLSTVDRVDDTKPPHLEVSVFGELALERLAAARLGGNRAYGLLDPALDARWKVTDDFGRRGGNDELQHVRARVRFLASRSGSPNTSSNDSPLPPRAK